MHTDLYPTSFEFEALETLIILLWEKQSGWVLLHHLKNPGMYLACGYRKPY